MEVKVEDEDVDQKAQLFSVLNMPPGFKCDCTLEGEQGLDELESYDKKKDTEHIYWLPHDLMI